MEMEKELPEVGEGYDMDREGIFTTKKVD